MSQLYNPHVYELTEYQFNPTTNPLKKGTPMKPTLQTWRNIAILALLLATPAVVSADIVTDINAFAVQATITGARPGPTGALDIAMVHAAVYDAIQAIEKRYEPYYVEIPEASGSSVAAAVKAARDVLVNRFPAQTDSIDAAYRQYLAAQGLSEIDPGRGSGGGSRCRDHRPARV